MASSPADNPSVPSDALPEKAAASGMITRAFSLSREDFAIIEAVKQEEGLISQSAALRRLIRDGQRFRTRL